MFMTKTIIADRIDKRLIKLGISAADASRRAGLSSDAIRNIRNGKSKNPKFDTLKRLAAVLECDVTYITGTSDDTPDEIREAKQSDFIYVDAFDFKPGMGGGGIVPEYNEPSFRMPLSPEYARKARLNTKHLISVEAEGDSMAPHLLSGDQILIDTSDKNPARGGIFAVTINETIVVKRLEIVIGAEPPKLKLISSNPEHSPYEALIEETNIVGRVVWFARRM